MADPFRGGAFAVPVGRWWNWQSYTRCSHGLRFDYYWRQEGSAGQLRGRTPLPARREGGGGGGGTLSISVQHSLLLLPVRASNDLGCCPQVSAISLHTLPSFMRIFSTCPIIASTLPWLSLTCLWSLCYEVLCCEVLYRNVLCNTVLCSAMLYCAVLYCALQCYTVLCCTVMSTVPYCTVLYCTLLYCAMLCCALIYSLLLTLNFKSPRRDWNRKISEVHGCLAQGAAVLSCRIAVTLPLIFKIL